MLQEETKYVPSWTREEQLEEITQIHRFNEKIKGIVRSIETEQVRINKDGKTQNVKDDILIIALPNGVTGYCAAKEFAIHEFKNTRKLVGRTADFVIKDILLEEKMLVLSGKEAQQRNIEEFWETVTQLEQANALSDHTFEGEVSGTSPDGRLVHVRVHGQDCYLHRSEWSWNSWDRPVVEEGEKIEVKIKRFDKENRIVEVSRRLTLPDPFVFLEKLKVGDTIAGKVSRVDPVHGIFVQMEDGLDVKAGKIKVLEEPIVGDIVTCRVAEVFKREENGRIRGRVIIVAYPNGKRKRKDLGSFLFE